MRARDQQISSLLLAWLSNRLVEQNWLLDHGSRHRIAPQLIQQVKLVCLCWCFLILYVFLWIGRLLRIWGMLRLLGLYVLEQQRRHWQIMAEHFRQELGEDEGDLWVLHARNERCAYTCLLVWNASCQLLRLPFWHLSSHFALRLLLAALLVIRESDMCCLKLVMVGSLLQGISLIVMPLILS